MNKPYIFVASCWYARNKIVDRLNEINHRLSDEQFFECMSELFINDNCVCFRYADTVDSSASILFFETEEDKLLFVLKHFLNHEFKYIDNPHTLLSHEDTVYLQQHKYFNE